MKVIQYQCDRCKKEIDKDELYTIVPERLDPNSDLHRPNVPDEVMGEFGEYVEDKHLCLDCLRKIFKNAFRVPAIINQDFENAIQDMQSQTIVVDCAKSEPEQVPVAKDNDKRKFKPRIIKDDFVRMYLQENKTAKEVAEHFGVTVSAVHTYAWKHNLSKNPRQKNTEMKYKPASREPDPKNQLTEAEIKSLGKYKICRRCGKEFYIESGTQWQYKRLNNKTGKTEYFCSYSCYSKE